MRWFQKKKTDSPVSSAAPPPTREDIIAQAKANMRGARERIGEEEIQKIAKALFHKDDAETKH